MAGARRQSANSLIERLQAEPWRFDALVAVRLLEHAHGRKPTIAGRLDRSFPPNDVMRMAPQLPAKLEIASFGLADILPDAYLELLKQRESQALRDFVSLFEQRLITTKLDQLEVLFPGLGRRRVDETPIGAALISLIGLGTSGLRQTMSGRPQDRLAGDESAFMATAGLLVRRPLSLDSMTRFVGFHLREKVRALPFAGRQRPLPEDCHCIIGTAGQNRRLGRDTVLGKQAFDASAGVRLSIGPVTQERAIELMPGGCDHDRLNRLLAFAAGPTLEVEPILLMKSVSIRGARLADSKLSALGRTSFIGRQQHPSPTIRLPRVA